MENQHRKIRGYRELSEAEIALMNKIKELGPLIEAVELQVRDHVKKQELQAYNRVDNAQTTAEAEAYKEEVYRLNDAEPSRFIALAKTQFQTGLMYLTRAVAQPTFY